MRKHTMALTILFLVLAAPVRAGDSPLDAAMAAFRGGEFEKAVEICSGVAEDDPLYPKARYLRGEARLLLGLPADAEADFRAVLEAKPDAVPALTGLGRALLAKGEAAEAISWLEKATQGDPKDPAAWCAYGRALAATGKKSDGEKALAKAWKLAKKDPIVCRAFVEFLLAEDRLPEADTVAKGLRKATPKHPMGWFLAGLVLDRDGKSEEAIAMYEKALECDETFLDAHKNIGIICHAVNPTYQDIERTKKAFHHYQRYFDLGGEDETLRRIYLQTKGFLEQMGALK